MTVALNALSFKVATGVEHCSYCNSMVNTRMETHDLPDRYVSEFYCTTCGHLLNTIITFKEK